MGGCIAFVSSIRIGCKRDSSSFGCGCRTFKWDVNIDVQCAKVRKVETDDRDYKGIVCDFG